MKTETSADPVAWPGSTPHAAALDEAAIVAITNLAGDITYCNDRFCAVSGYSREELVGSNHRILKSGLHERAYFADMFHTLASGGVWRGVLSNRRKTGELYWVDTTIVPELGEDGRPVAYIAIRFEVTLLMEALAEVDHARARAESASADKNRFFANMSHEIRTPLTAVMGFLDLMAATSLDPEQAGYVGSMREASALLSTLVNDVLTLAQSEACAIVLAARPTNLNHLVDDLARRLSPVAAAKGLALTLDLGGGLPDGLLVDPARLSQILTHLTGNALKFTETGRVGLSLRWAEDRLRCEVTDSGPGFDPADKARLFRAFEQEASRTRRHAEGTGLGLPIAAGLVRAMDGVIDAESLPGAGARFWFEIPCGRAETVAEVRPVVATPDPAPGVGRILVVEDNATNQMLIRRILEGAGYAVEVANDGAEGLARLRAEPFDLCLMDLRMPVMAGPEAVAEIRRDPDARVRGAPVIALSADLFDPDEDNLRDQGFDGFLPKPIDIPRLLAAIQSWAGETHADVIPNVTIAPQSSEVLS